MVSKGDEDVFNVFTSLDEKSILEELSLILLTHVEELTDLLLILLRLLRIVLDTSKSIQLFGVIALDLEPGLMEVLSTVSIDLLSDIIVETLGIILNSELFEIIFEFLLGRLANCLSLLHEVISDFVLAIMVSCVGSLIKDMLSLSLIEDSFSHVLVLLKSGHLLDELFDDHYKLFVSILLIIRVSSRLFDKLILEFEELKDVILSYLLDLLLDGALKFFWVSKSIGSWVNCGTDFLSERNKSTSWSNGTKYLKLLELGLFAVYNCLKTLL